MKNKIIEKYINHPALISCKKNDLLQYDLSFDADKLTNQEYNELNNNKDYFKVLFLKSST